jgi:hypothetical protein
MKNKITTIIILLSTAIASGYFLYDLLKKLGLGDTFDFDLFEDVDQDEEL